MLVRETALEGNGNTSRAVFWDSMGSNFVESVRPEKELAGELGLVFVVFEEEVVVGIFLYVELTDALVDEAL